MILQLDPYIPVETPKGKGYAMGWLDYSQEHNLLWIVAHDVGGEVWIIDNKDIRVQSNYTMGRSKGEKDS